MRRPLRVLYVHHTSCLGGAEQSLVDMISAMDRSAVLPAIAAPEDGPLTERLFRLGVDVYFVPLAGLRRTYNPLKILYYTGALAGGAVGVLRAALTHRACLIHANSIGAAPYAGPAARIAGARSVLHLRDMIPLGPAGRTALGMFDSVVSVSKAVAASYRLMDPVVIPSGVDFSRFDGDTSDIALRAAASMPRGCPVVGMAGQLVSWKNHADFIRAASRIRSRFDEARFVIAGPDISGDNPSYRAELADLAGNLGVADRLTFLGWWDDMPGLYASLDVLVHPALDEPFGRVLVEAMGCGVPVVAYDCGGPSEIVRDSKTGFLVAPGDWEALAGQTCRILKDKNLRSNLAVAAKKDARSRFGADLTAYRVMELYGVT